MDTMDRWRWFDVGHCLVEWRTEPEPEPEPELVADTANNIYQWFIKHEEVIINTQQKYKEF